MANPQEHLVFITSCAAGAAGALSLVALYDFFQTHHAILRNYPLLAHLRFFFETIRPEIRQYLLEGELAQVP